jgi:hypothetical protein
MNRTALCLTLAAIMLTECGTKENQIVEEVKKDGSAIKVLHLDRIPDETIDMNLSDLFTGFEIIPLETNSECLAPYLIWIYFTNNNIFIAHQNVSGGAPGPASLLRFDRKGSFINKIGRGGRGPGEHLGYSLNSLIANDESEELFVDWQPDSMDDELMHYKYDGTFIREIPVPMQSLYNKERYADNKWFALGTTAGKQNFGAPATQSDSVMMVFFTDNGEITKIVPRINYPPAGSDKYSPTGGRYLYYQNKEYFIYMAGVDTIFRVSEENLIPIWILHRGRDAVPYNINIDRSSLAGKHDIRFVAETGKNLILWKFIGADIKTIIVDKQTNKAAYVNIIDDVFGFIKPEEFIHNNLSTIIDSRISMSWEAVNYINSLKENNIDPESLIKYSTNPERLRSISSNSNPVIITYNITSHIKLK